MLQRINAILMILVLLVIAFVSVQMFFTQRYNTLALSALQTELAGLRAEQAASERHLATIAQRSTGTYHVVGGVKWQGSYQLPGESELRVSGAVAAAGGADYPGYQVGGMSRTLEDVPVTKDKWQSLVDSLDSYGDW